MFNGHLRHHGNLAHLPQQYFFPASSCSRQSLITCVSIQSTIVPSDTLLPGAQLYPTPNVASRKVNPELCICVYIPYTLGGKSVKLLLCVDQFGNTSMQLDWDCVLCSPVALLTCERPEELVHRAGCRHFVCVRVWL